MLRHVAAQKTTTMTYQETCNYLFNQTPSFEKSGKTGFNEGLAVTLALDEHFGHPHQHYKTIHVAGTNGKGSVSHTLAAQLQAAGYRVGLYTSPHLVDFRERIRINGEMIPEQYVIDFVDDFLNWNNTPHSTLHTPHSSKLSPSFFELTTAMAFKYFMEQHVDIAVIEVGLGGRLDCTNIITPVLSVITNISFDHTDMLGDTLAKIAAEKAGIIKSGIPVVIGETLPETRPVFALKAKEMNAPIVFADEHPLVQMTSDHYTTTDGITFHGDLKGLYQLKNTNTALYAMQQLIAQGILKEINYEAFASVCKSTGLMARWQVMQENPTVVCDTGHNPGGWEYLSRQLTAVNCRQMHIVFGMVSDKDVKKVMAMLPKKAHYYFTKARTKRALPESVLQQIANDYELDGSTYPSVAEAVKTALQTAEPEDFVFIGGSTYVVAEYLETSI